MRGADMRPTSRAINRTVVLLWLSIPIICASIIVSFGGGLDLFVFIPLLPISIAVSVLSAFFWWREWLREHRHFPFGHCRRCGYDLTGNTSGVCPECGTAIDSQPSPPMR